MGEGKGGRREKEERRRDRGGGPTRGAKEILPKCLISASDKRRRHVRSLAGPCILPPGEISEICAGNVRQVSGRKLDGVQDGRHSRRSGTIDPFLSLAKGDVLLNWVSTFGGLDLTLSHRGRCITSVSPSTFS